MLGDLPALSRVVRVDEAAAGVARSLACRRLKSLGIWLIADLDLTVKELGIIGYDGGFAGEWISVLRQTRWSPALVWLAGRTKGQSGIASTVAAGLHVSRWMAAIFFSFDEL